MHKETAKPRTARAVGPKKETGKKAQGADISPSSKTSFFGSLRRNTGVTTSTPKSTPTATRINDVAKTTESPQLRNRPPDKEKRPWFRTTSSNLLRKDPVKSSITSLNSNAQNSPNVTKRRRPLTLQLVSNVTVRRGQNAKLDGQNLPDNLSRTSSITNIDAEQKVAKGAKPRKSASRDRIDKVGEGKKNDKKGVTKNNNKLESGDSPYPSIDSLQEEEFVQLRRQLQEMAQEKSNLALQLGEQKGQLNILQKEIQSLKSFQEESNLQLEQLTEENTALRNRLRDVAHSPLSDNEKQQLLYETHHRHHSSAPASIATNLIDEGTGGDITACTTPDWDKHSSSNVSEVSVACLQDKINQMQETHYSTNEELQATLQELTDLQRQLTELQQENERLNEEKTLMFDSLCRQTERLNDSRSEVESLKQLLYREKDEAGQYESAIEREQKLVELLKSAQEEKQALLLKLEQANNEIQESRAGIIEKDERITQLSERVRTLESTLDAKHAEHKLMDQELAQAKDQCSGKQIEINRLTDLLDNARTKIIELEQDRALSDKSELDELLDNARKEKDSLESEVAHLKEQLAISKNEIEKLKEQVSILQEECKVTRNNARTKQSDLEYKCEKLISEKNNLNDQLLEFQEAINELQVQSQCQLEDKRQLSSVLSETQRNLSEAERKNVILESELQELKKVRSEEVEEWEKFQNDLLTSVRVANDFKTEAQQDLQRMILENKSLREKERQLKSEIEKLKGDKKNKKEESFKPKLVENRNSIDMENLLGLSKRSRDKPKKGKDAVDAAPAKDNKHKERKPEVPLKPVKKREKPTARSKKNKTLSVEEELLLKSLNDWYENIDKNILEENLTEEQKVIKKLKTLYEDDSLKSRPVAHKPKNLLAISKPLLDSVFLNPKLEEIVKDPNMPTIEETENYDVLSEHDTPEVRNLPEIPGRSEGVRSVDLTKLNEQKKASIFSRSKSCDDLYNLDDKHDPPPLYRSTETEDLRKDTPFVLVQRESSILPSDSVSNPRYSDFAYVIDNRIRQENVERGHEAIKLSRNSSVNYETLESILASVPKDVTEEQLNSEQKFAMRLKKALDEAERKNTLKKVRKGKKQVVISSPTADSVEKNAKLRDILLNPQIQGVGRNSEVDNAGPFFKDPIRQSKSYQDISFSFNVPPNDHKSLDSTHSTLGDSYGFNTQISQTDTFSSTEYDAEENLSSPFEIKNFNTFKENDVEDKSVSKDQNNAADNLQLRRESQDRDLLYNETLNTRSQSARLSGRILKDLDPRSHSVYEARNYKVMSFENDDVGKNHVTTVTTSAEYVLVLDDLQSKKRISDVTDSGSVKYKVKTLEEPVIDKHQTVTVVTPEENILVLDKVPDKNRFSDVPDVKTRSHFVVKRVDEDEIRSATAVVVTPEEHVAVLEDTYNKNRISYSPREEIPPQLKVKIVDEDDEIVRSHTAAVVTPERRHVAVLEETHNKNSVSYSPREEIPAQFKVKFVDEDDEIVKRHTAAVVTPERHVAVLEETHNKNRVSYSPREEIPPQFKVKILDEDDEIVRSHTAAVVIPERRHVAVLEETHNKNHVSYSPRAEISSQFKVKDDDDTVRSCTAAVVAPERHVAVLEEEAHNNHRISYSPREESSPQFKVIDKDDDTVRSCTAAVVAPERHVAVLEEAHNNHRISYSPREEIYPQFKVKLVNEDDEIIKSHTATVAAPERHVAVLEEAHNKHRDSYTPREEIRPYFIVKCLDEDEIDRRRTTTVITPVEHIAIMDDSHLLNSVDTKTPAHFENIDEDETGTSYSPTAIASREESDTSDLKPNITPTNFKVKSVEYDVKNRIAVVIPPNEYTTVFNDSHSLESTPTTFTVVSDDDEVDKNNYTTVIQSQEHTAIWNEDLTYNETLNKKLRHTQQSIEDDDYERPSDIPDIIVDVSNAATEESEDTFEKDYYTTDKIDASKKLSDLSYEEATWDTADHEEQNPEYDYHAILKENRYGVETPLNIRLSYKDVVKEIKTKFTPSKETDATHLEDDSVTESDTFFDEFFGIKRKTERTEPDGATSSNADDIDAEMEEIFEKYLHTPVSKVITRIDDNVDDFKELPKNLKTQNIEEDEVTSATNFAVLASERNDAPVLNDGNFEQVIGKEDIIENEKDDNKNNLREEFSEVSSKDEDTITDKILSHDLDKELVLTEEEKQTQQIVESVNKNLSLINNIECSPKLEMNANTDNGLSEEEQNLLRSLENVRYSRPLSDFSEKDLRMIAEISSRYLPEQSKTEIIRDDNTKLVESSPSLEVKTVEKIEIENYHENSSPTSVNPILPDETVNKNSSQDREDCLIFYEVLKKDGEDSRNNESNVLTKPVPKDKINDVDVTIPKPNFDSHPQRTSLPISEKENARLDDRLPHISSVAGESQQTKVKEKLHENKFSVPKSTQDIANRKFISSNKPKIVASESKTGDDEDYLIRLLTKMSAPSNLSKRRVEKQVLKDIELKDGKPKVVLRNTNYEGVKSKLEFFSKRSTEATELKRQSLNPHSDAIPDRRKVRSWAERFEKRSLDAHTSYEPVYANLESLNLHRTNSATSSKIEKKPLPIPRSRNLGGVSVKNSDSSLSDNRNDTSVDEIKMSDCKIISENDTENLSQEHPGSDFSNIGKIKVPDVPVYSETSRAMPEGSLEVIENDENLKIGVLGINRSEKFLEMRDGSRENAAVKDELENLATGAESSFSSIAVAGKFEELDLTKHADDIEEVITTNNESRLNLFHLETPSYDESYLSLFKSPEEKMYEDISGVRKPQKGYFNIAYLGEVSDSESCEDMNRSVIDDKILEGSNSKPKIIDFVPLDDATKPVFKKDNKTEQNFDTLEREKTFHVLNIAASTGAVRKSASSTEHKNFTSATSSSSRMSFSAAKKVFETLLESNTDINRERDKPVIKNRESIHRKSSEIEVKTSVTAVKKP